MVLSCYLDASLVGCLVLWWTHRYLHNISCRCLLVKNSSTSFEKHMLFHVIVIAKFCVLLGQKDINDRHVYSNTLKDKSLFD